MRDRTRLLHGWTVRRHGATGDDGTVDTTATRSIEVSVEGPGVLQGLLSAGPKSHRPSTGTTRQMSDVTALTVIRPTGDGENTVSVTADRLASASSVFEAVAS